MATSLDWPNKIIHVPRADMTLVQSVPTEIRELNLNAFRLDLKDLEDDQEGMAWIDTHSHNTEVTIGGLTLARVIEIINGYTVTFEDGQYAVNLIGANSNVGDVVNVNQVSVRSQNSAGMTSSPDIEYSSFNGRVTIDGLATGIGTTFPKGTPRDPVNNIPDALIINDYRKFNHFEFLTNFTLGAEADMEKVRVSGRTTSVELTVDALAQVYGSVFGPCTISGTLDGQNELRGCIVKDMDFFNGRIHNSLLNGTITLAGSDDAYMVNCTQLEMATTPHLNMGGSGQNLVMPNYIGLLHISNLDSYQTIGIGLSGGQVVLEDTVTAGLVHVSGVGELLDEHGDTILSGTWNGVTVINNLMSSGAVQDAVWSHILEVGFTADDIVKLMSSVLLGKSSGAGSNSIKFRDINDSKDRVTATLNEQGDRLTIVLDKS